MNLKDTEIAIKLIKDTFEERLANNLNLIRVSAPLFVKKNSGLNDDLSGVERPVSFDAKSYDYDIEIIHSLAKWKRMALKRYGFKVAEGLYTDMNAVRRDENVDYLHSIYVDQWDWEKVITREERNRDYLHTVVRKIVLSLYETAEVLEGRFKEIRNYIKNDVFFITADELLKKYPNLNPKQREYMITKEHKIVFIENVGKKLSDGSIHDLRAPDYDDWSLNGDLLVYHNALDEAIEISSMGIRVDADSLVAQLTEKNNLERLKYEYHKKIVNQELPLTIGGGIGQSRLCLVLLNKVHIGEVQASIWPQDMVEELEKKGIILL